MFFSYYKLFKDTIDLQVKDAVLSFDFYSFIDYSPYVLKAEFIAFLSTQSLPVLFSRPCPLLGGSE